MKSWEQELKFLRLFKIFVLLILWKIINQYDYSQFNRVSSFQLTSIISQV
jgi:hypothetical protein